MLSLRNGLLQKIAFLRHNRCIELGKRYIKAIALGNSRQVYSSDYFNLISFRRFDFGTFV